MARRDPAGRRQVIVDAALELLAEQGLSRLTHRAIAARAGVPLGATTYYFPTLKDLVGSCLEHLGERNEAQLQAWAKSLADSDDVAEMIGTLVEGYLGDRDSAALEYELYVAAARDEELRVPAAAWVPGLRAVLGRSLESDQAAAVAMLIDGAILQTLAVGGPPPIKELRAGVALLIRGRHD